MILKLLKVRVSNTEIRAAIAEELDALESRPTELPHKVAGQSCPGPGLPIETVHDDICAWLDAFFDKIEDGFGDFWVIFE